MIVSILAGILIAAVFSVRFNWWRSGAKGLPVLMYHKIGRAPASSKYKKLWVTPEKFARHMDYLKKHGYTFISFTELAYSIKTGESLPENPVLVTFDDGYRNNYTEAWKILKDKGGKGNIFLVYNTVGKHDAWQNPADEPWEPMLTWEEIRAMQESGIMDFGSHTMNHPALPHLAPETAAWELRESKKRLGDRLGREVTCFAYPYGAGALDKAMRRLVKEAGYICDFGIRQGITPMPWQKEDLALKRLLIRGDDTMLDFHLQLTRGKSRF